MFVIFNQWDNKRVWVNTDKIITIKTEHSLERKYYSICILLEYEEESRKAEFDNYKDFERTFNLLTQEQYQF